MLRLGIALARNGNSTRADQVLASVIEASSDPRIRLHASIERAFVQMAQATPGAFTGSHRLAEESISVFEGLGDTSGIAKAWRLIATVAWNRAQFDTGVALCAGRSPMPEVMTSSKRGRSLVS
jgi:hypothetical protein